MEKITDKYGNNELIETTKCLFTNKCISYDSEYYFVLNGERVKDDECFSNVFGYSSCTYNDIEYKNISYERIEKGYHYKNSQYYLFIIPLIVLGAMVLFLKFLDKLLRGY